MTTTMASVLTMPLKVYLLSGARPFIKANGLQPQAVHVYNSEYFVIWDLEISNTSATPVEEIFFCTITALHNPNRQS
jgi:hypothetical protein